MKGRFPRITLLGNNAGRNLGDMAILSSILSSLARHLPAARFYVPSTNPQWTRQHYGDRFDVKALNVMPWTGSVRLLGVPTLGALAASDVAMICDGIIFGNRLFNPAFNYLITLVALVPLARLLRCRVVCYSVGLGPFPSRISRLLARWTINLCDLVMVRDRNSERLAREIGVTKPIALTGDAAFINPVSGDRRAREILGDLGIDPHAQLLGLNITAYMDRWLKSDEKLPRDADFVTVMAEGVRRAQAAVSEPFTPLVICTQPMDGETCQRLAAAIGGKVLSNSKYLSHDIQAVMRRCQLMVGMRFHSLVLASSVGTPVMALNYAPKVRDYMRLLDCEEFGMELASATLR
jgi:polysaccharide pyruvyl transferase WcaK-like protein